MSKRWRSAITPLLACDDSRHSGRTSHTSEAGVGHLAEHRNIDLPTREGRRSLLLWTFDVVPPSFVCVRTTMLLLLPILLSFLHSTASAKELVRVRPSGLAVEVQTQSNAVPSNLVFGYRASTFMIGGYAEFATLSEGNGGVTTSVRWSGGLTLRNLIAASSDKDVELFVQGDVGAGQSTIASSGVEVRGMRFSYSGGIGLNMWLHPQFAIGGRMGIRGEEILGDLPLRAVRSDAGIHVLAVF